MPEDVVYFLEAIQVDAENRDLCFAAGGLRQGSSQMLIEEGAVLEARQSVMLGQIFDPGLGPPPLGRILMRRDPAASRHRIAHAMHTSSIRQFDRARHQLAGGHAALD